MFLQIFAAAKGLFTTQDSTSNSSDVSKVSAASAKNRKSPRTPKMVTATRRGQVGTLHSATSQVSNGSTNTNGKRKGRLASSSSGKADTSSGKRRKKDSQDVTQELDAVAIPGTQDVNGNLDNGVEPTSNGKAEQDTLQSAEKSTLPAKSGYIRFGSEELVSPVNVIEEIPETQQNQQNEGSESESDDAPEAFDNSSELQKIRAQLQKQEEAKKRDEILKKEKRRQFDEMRKLQAKASGKIKMPLRPFESKPTLDDTVSESTATLQGSISKEFGRHTLPALLPDDILNAEPVARLSSPPPEVDSVPGRKPQNQKLKFLDKIERPAKDVHRGGMTIRVLEDSSSNKKGMANLPPKLSKSGRHFRESWIAGQRSKNNPNGLRRAAGGPLSFVRR